MKQQLILIEIILTSILVGLILTIQFVNYPGFEYVGSLGYSAFHKFHVKAISPLVAPLMIAEFLVCALNLYLKNHSLKFGLLLLTLIFIIWLATLVYSMPVHEKLVIAKDDALIKQLVLTNWIRTGGWTLRLILLAFFSKK